MKLASLLPANAVLPHLNARDKKQVLKALAAHATEFVPIGEREVYSVLLEREQIGCTGMGNGIAIPHGRFEGMESLHAIFAKLDHPIEFGSADGKPVDLVFLLLTPAAANTQHLKAIAVISRLLRDRELVKSIRMMTDAAAIHKLLIDNSDDV